MKKLFITILLTISSFYSYSQQGIFSGVILDDEYKTPIPFASIWLEGNSYGVMSDDKGRFSIRLRTEKETIIIRAFGYKLRALEVATNKKDKKIYLAPLKTILPEVNVQGLGPKAILLKALRSVGENYLKDKTFYLEMESLMQKKVNDSLLYLYWNNDIYKRWNIIGMKLLLPSFNGREEISNKEGYYINYVYFGIDDIVYYYMVYILNSNIMAKDMAKNQDTNNFKYSLKITMQDSIETEYIVSLHQNIEQNKSSSLFELPKIISFFIDAQTMAITKIESALDKSKPRVFWDKKNGRFEIKEHITVVNFRELDGKYFLANCFSKVIFYNDRDGVKKKNSFFDGIKKTDLIEEIVIYDTKEMSFNEDEFANRKQKRTISPLEELIKNDVFDVFFNE